MTAIKPGKIKTPPPEKRRCRTDNKDKSASDMNSAHEHYHAAISDKQSHRGRFGNHTGIDLKVVQIEIAG
jgi:hypothetical protein